MRKIERQVAAYLDYCRDVRKMTPATLASREWTFKNFLGFLSGVKKMEDLTTQDVFDYMASFSQRGCTGRTVNSRLMEILPMLKYFRDTGLSMPKLNLTLIQKAKEEPPRQNHFTKEEIERALKCANQMEWLLIKLAFDCGLRLSELSNLRLSSLNGQIVRVVGKGRKLGEMRMTAETRQRLDVWIQSQEITDWLWPSPKYEGKPMQPATIRKRMAKPFRLAGLEGFYPHSLRHSFATDKQRKGATPMELQLLLRHSSFNTSTRYLHGLEGQAQNLFKKYEGELPVDTGKEQGVRGLLLELAQAFASSGDSKKLQNASDIYKLLAEL